MINNITPSSTFWFKTQLNTIDRTVAHWMARYGMVFMRIGLGIIFFWFGALKQFPGLSPAEELVRSTTYFVDPSWFLPFLASWEMTIGLCFISGRFMRLTLILLFLHMPGTALPLLILPEAVWTVFPYGLTLEGQYIVKNLVVVGAGLVLGGTIRGGRLEPEASKKVAPEISKVDLKYAKSGFSSRAGRKQ